MCDEHLWYDNLCDLEFVMIMCDLEFEMHYCEFWWISDTNFCEFDFVEWKFVMRMCVILILCDFGFVMWIYDGILWELVRWICGWRIFVNLWYEFVRMCGENLSEFLCWRFIILWWRWVITICDEFMFYEFVWISKMDDIWCIYDEMCVEFECL